MSGCDLPRRAMPMLTTHQRIRPIPPGKAYSPPRLGSPIIPPTFCLAAGASPIFRNLFPSERAFCSPTAAITPTSVATWMEFVAYWGHASSLSLVASRPPAGDAAEDGIEGARTAHRFSAGHRGGSAIDGSKFIAAAAYCPGDPGRCGADRLGHRAHRALLQRYGDAEPAQRLWSPLSITCAVFNCCRWGAAAY